MRINAGRLQPEAMPQHCSHQGISATGIRCFENRLLGFHHPDSILVPPWQLKTRHTFPAFPQKLSGSIVAPQHRKPAAKQDIRNSEQAPGSQRQIAGYALRALHTF